MSQQDVRLAVAFIEADGFLSIASCLRQLLGLPQSGSGSISHFGFLRVIGFHTQRFVEVLHSSVVVTFLVIHICYAYGSIRTRVNTIQIVGSLEIRLALITLHHLQDGDGLLQESGVGLVFLNFRTVDILQGLTIGYTAVHEHSYQIVLDCLQHGFFLSVILCCNSIVSVL